MRIGINFDNTITDTNYSLIDVINKNRKKEEQIKYSEFDKSLCTTIWEFKNLSDKEKYYRNYTEDDFLSLIDICPLAHKEINKLIAQGNDIIILSSRDEKYRNNIINFLKRKWININSDNIYLGLTNKDKADLAKNLCLDFYIEDDPKVLSECIKNRVKVVVRDQYYNKNYKNLIRLECFSQLIEINNRFQEKVEN